MTWKFDSAARESLGCVTNFSEKCVTGPPKLLLKKIYGTVKRGLDERCDNENKASEFVENVKCLNTEEKIEAVRMCSDKHIKLLEKVVELEFGQRTGPLCCSFQVNIHSIRSHLSQLYDIRLFSRLSSNVPRMQWKMVVERIKPLTFKRFSMNMYIIKSRTIHSVFDCSHSFSVRWIGFPHLYPIWLIGQVCSKLEARHLVNHASDHWVNGEDRTQLQDRCPNNVQDDWKVHQIQIISLEFSTVGK